MTIPLLTKLPWERHIVDTSQSSDWLTVCKEAAVKTSWRPVASDEMK